MSVRLTVVFSDELIEAIDRVVKEDSSSRSEVLRKSLQLYLTAYGASRQGFKIGLVEPKTGALHTEVVGL